MTAYLGYMQVLLRRLKFYNISQIPREKNAKADALARLATADPSLLPGNHLAIEHLSKPSISKTFSEVFAVEQTMTWMDPILQYKLEGKLPEEKLEARRLILRSSRYNIQDGKLYKRGLSMPNLRCIPRDEGEAVLQDIHAGACGNHSGARSLAHKALRTGYFWPTLAEDARKISQTCHKCQQFATIPRVPAEPLSIIISPWPYAQWGLDLIGKLPTARGQFKYAIVAVDYSTKWVEAAPLTAITTTKVKRFLWKNIYCRFGVPDTIITDNGTQFDNDDLREFTSKMGTKILYSSPAHPQTNGQVEAVNKILKTILKKKLDTAKGLWAEKLPEALWSIRTTPTTATGETPFCLSFGTEAVIPVEITHPSARTQAYDPATNDEGLNLDRDLLEEKRDAAHFHNLQNKQRIARYYNLRVKTRTLKVGDWAMKQVIPPPTGLRPTWEGPFELTEESSPGTFYLRNKDGETSRHPWNTERLRYYYK
jgi:hypothetical protein